MLSQQISWLFDPIISSSSSSSTTSSSPSSSSLSLSLTLSLSLGDRGSSNNSSRCTGEQQWSSQREPQWSRTEAEQPTSPLVSGDVSNNLRGVGS